MCLVRKSALALFIVLSVIAATLNETRRKLDINKNVFVIILLLFFPTLLLSENVINEVRQIIHSLCNVKDITKKSIKQYSEFNNLIEQN